MAHWIPTLITDAADALEHRCHVLAEALEDPALAAHVPGIHLEGPHISPLDGPRGAHPAAHVLPPSVPLFNRLYRAAKGKIAYITLAPELPGSTALIRVCRELGMLVAIGHTAATADDIQRAVDAGASLSTHLGNGAHAMLPRHPNYIWEQLAEDRLYASMIADGFHLSDSVLKVFSRTKGEKGILVSDSMCFGGMKPGEYESPATGKIHLSPEGKLHIAGNPKLLAGSASSLLEGIVHLARLTGFATAWEMGSLHPARLMNAQRPRGLKVGAPADLVLLEGGESDSHGDIGANMNGDSNLNRAKVIEVYKNGTPIYKRP